MFVQNAVHSGVPIAVGQFDPTQLPELAPPSDKTPESSPPHATAKRAKTSIALRMVVPGEGCLARIASGKARRGGPWHDTNAAGTTMVTKRQPVSER
jgi:hypothetical protein